MKNVYENVNIKTATIATPSVGSRLGEATLAMVFGGGALVSLWSITALVGAVVTSGTAGVAQGLITAVTGI